MSLKWCGYHVVVNMLRIFIFVSVEETSKGC
ncbi:hypothetical protein VPHF99_0151 [Vibrio phage F99]